MCFWIGLKAQISSADTAVSLLRTATYSEIGFMDSDVCLCLLWQHMSCALVNTIASSLGQVMSIPRYRLFSFANIALLKTSSGASLCIHEAGFGLHLHRWCDRKSEAWCEMALCAVIMDWAQVRIRLSQRIILTMHTCCLLRSFMKQRALNGRTQLHKFGCVANSMLTVQCGIPQITSTSCPPRFTSPQLLPLQIWSIPLQSQTITACEIWGPCCLLRRMLRLKRYSWVDMIRFCLTDTGRL